MSALEQAAHTRDGIDAAWAALGSCGTWWTGAERVALAAELRAARGCALCAERKRAVSPYAVADAHAARPPLSAAAVDAVHRLATDPGRLSERWYGELLAAGLEPEQVVELAGLAGVVIIADTLARGHDEPERALPRAGPGEPARMRPAGLRVDRGWVPMVDPEQAQGEVAALYAGVAGSTGFVFNVARALTAVPAALRSFYAAFLPNYTIAGEVPPGGLERSQVELLAASTSAENDCFY